MADTESLAAFRAFDFDNNSKWKHYKANLEIPAGRDVASTVEKFKAKWYQREVDPGFDLSSFRSFQSETGPSQSSAQPQTATSTEAQRESTATHEQPAAREVPKAPAPHRHDSTSKGRLSSLQGLLQLGPQAALFGLHVSLVILALLHLQPFNRKWSYYAWLYFLSASILSSGYKVYLKYGAPSLRPFPSALKTWAGPVTSTSDFHYAMLSMLFLSSRPIALVLVPISVLATYHCFAFASNRPRITTTAAWQQYGQRMHQWLAAHQREALLYNAVAEIGIGFVSILGLLSPPRNFLLPFLVFNFLRMRYWSPDAASYHRQAWMMVNQRAAPLLHYAPILQTPISWVQRWFLSVPGR